MVRLTFKRNRLAEADDHFYRSGVKLEPYQKKAAMFAFVKRCAALIMGKGTGKTITSLEVIRMAKPKTVLIVTNSKNSIQNWERQIEKFVISHRSWDRFGIHLFIPGTCTRIHIRLYNPYQYKIDGKVDMFILDESHSIKNRRSKRFKTLNRMRKQFPLSRRIIMTATPTSLNQIDLWSQYVFLGLFPDSWKHFVDRWCEAYGFMMKKNRLQEDMVEAFMSEIDKITYYVGDEVLKLKDHSHEEVKLKFSKPHQDIYNVLEEEFILQFQDINIVTPNTLAQMAKLHQICGGTIKTESGTRLFNPCEKLNWTLDFIERTEGKIVVFCAYNNEITRLGLELKKRGIRHELLWSGAKNKDGWVKFQDNPIIRVIVVQFASGAQSIDLQASNTIIYYSLNFRYIDFDQSLGRIRRRGQTEETKAYFLIVENTIDRLVFNNLHDKKAIAQSVFDQLKKKRH